MKIRQIYMYMSLAAVALGMSACNDFLDKLPDNRMELNNKKKTNKLLVSAYPERHPALLFEMYSDNTDAFLNTGWTSAGRFQDQAFAWDDITEVDDDETPQELWNAQYKAMAAANITIDAIKKQGETTDLLPSKGEALLCRAYAAFNLANTFCMAYDATKAQKEMGLPYPTEPETKVGSAYKRGTLAEFYDQINRDIEAGLPLVNDNYEKPKFHFTKQAAYAFATRFYLYAQKYDKAVKYANMVLGDQPADILRNWAEWNRLGPSGNVQPNAFVAASNNANIMLLTVPSQWGVISIPILAGSKYAHGELISKNETLQAPGPWGDSGSSLNYTVLYNNGVSKYCLRKIPYVPKVIDATAEIGVPYGEYAVFSTDITLLERAEAYALLGQYDKALKDINTELTVFSKNRKQLKLADIQYFYGSMAYYTPTKPTPKKKLNPLFTVEATTQEPLLQCLLQLKRLVTIHEGFRLQDVKRYGITMYRRKVDVQSNVTAVTDSMKIGDPRLAIQLPQDVITAGVKPNPRNN